MIQQSQIDVRFTKQTFSKDECFTKTEYKTSANLWKMNATRELAHQSKAKHKQAPQNEANACRRQKCNLKKPSLLSAQDTQ